MRPMLIFSHFISAAAVIHVSALETFLLTFCVYIQLSSNWKLSLKVFLRAFSRISMRFLILGKIPQICSSVERILFPERILSPDLSLGLLCVWSGQVTLVTALRRISPFAFLAGLEPASMQAKVITIPALRTCVLLPTLFWAARN